MSVIQTLLLPLLLALQCAGNPPEIPLPSAAQLKYQSHEIMALITFNMGTFGEKEGDPVCNQDNWGENSYGGPLGDPRTFSPSKLNTSQWASVAKRLGAKHAVLTAKHGCGFLLWPTKTTLPSGRKYGYDVGFGMGVDVLRKFVDSFVRVGISHGFYYSLKNNFYLDVYKLRVRNSTLLPGQFRVSQQAYDALALAQVKELFTQYGDLFELWLDGGYQPQVQARLKEMLQRYQPHTNVWRGDGITKNKLCWVGTESGHPPKEIWSTGIMNPFNGNPNSTEFCPKGSDTVLQRTGWWFYKKQAPVRSLKEMIQVYHQTVGRNSVLELDFAIDMTGRVAPAHATIYEQLGDWIRSCYGQPLREVKHMTCSKEGCVLPLQVQGEAFDRAVVREDLSKGQRVLSYVIEAKTESGWTALSSGQSIGNKRIDIFPQVQSTTELRLRINSFHGKAAYITSFAVYARCDDGSHSPNVQRVFPTVLT